MGPSDRVLHGQCSRYLKKQVARSPRLFSLDSVGVWLARDEGAGSGFHCTLCKWRSVPST